MAAKERQSNLELLRLIAMLGVLTVHTDFGVLGFPNHPELISDTSYCILRTIIEMFAVVSVNVFVLISGWFGISFKYKGLANLLFQCAYFLFGIYLALIAFGYETLSLGGIYTCLMFTENVWFVKAYIGMYIFAPIMNAFVQTVNRKRFRAFLICFFIFQCLYGWFSNGASYIMAGYSAFSFMGLYLFGRYINIYRPKFSLYTAKCDFLMYCGISLLSATLFLVLLYVDKPSFYRTMIYYTSPFVIAASLYLLMSFAKMPFYSKWINKIAISCFAVYLMHFKLFPDFMRPLISKFAVMGKYYMIPILLLSFFVAAIIVDRGRLLIWNKLLSPRFK